MCDGLDSKATAQLELVAEVYRCEFNTERVCVGFVFHNSKGARTIEWVEGFNPEKARMVEVPMAKKQRI